MKKPTAGRNRNSSRRQAAFCADPIKRPNYFAGRLLTAEDLTAEQNYQREKQRRHNRHCHGVGVVQGLRVSTVHEDSGWTVVVGPGVAIDPAGNEIQLCIRMKFQLPESPTAIWVGIRFAERFCDPVPMVSGATSPGAQPSRVEEGCEVLLNPGSMAGGSRGKAGGAGLAPDFLPLAQLVRRGCVWKVNRKLKVLRAEIAMRTNPTLPDRAFKGQH